MGDRISDEVYGQYLDKAFARVADVMKMERLRSLGKPSFLGIEFGEEKFGFTETPAEKQLRELEQERELASGG